MAISMSNHYGNQQQGYADLLYGNSGLSYIGSTSGTTTIVSGITSVNLTLPDVLTNAMSKPESNEQWLRRRVDEMCWREAA